MIVRYATRILEYSSKNIWIRVFIVCVNTLICGGGFYLQIEPFAFYLLAFFCYFLEFRLISKATVRQIFFGVSVFMLHISTLDLLGTIVYATMKGIPPRSVFEQASYFYEKNVYVFGILILVLIAFNNLIPVNSIIRISKTPVYGTLIASVATFMTVYTAFDVYALVRESRGGQFC